MTESTAARPEDSGSHGAGAEDGKADPRGAGQRRTRSGFSV